MAAGKKRKKPRNFTAVAKETLKKDFGCELVDECENRISSRMKRDFLGFVDMIGLAPGVFVMLQFTSKINAMARRHKIVANENAKYVVENGIARVIVIGFDSTKYGDDYRLIELEPSDFEGVE